MVMIIMDRLFEISFTLVTRLVNDETVPTKFPANTVMSREEQYYDNYHALSSSTSP